MIDAEGNGRGDVAVAWEMCRWHPTGCEPARVMARQRTPDGGWRKVRAISRKGQPASLWDVAIDADGDAIVVWTASVDQERYGAFARRLGHRGAVGPIQRLAVGETVTRPEVAVDERGNALFTWTYQRVRTDPAMPERVRARRMSAAGILQPVQDLGAADLGDPSPAMTDGQGIVTWDAGMSVYFARVSADGTSGTAQLAATMVDETQIWETRPLIDRAGDAVIVWLTGGEPTDDNLYATRLLADGGIGTPWRVAPNVNQFRTGMDADGNLRVIWETDNREPEEQPVLKTRYVPRHGAMGSTVRLAKSRGGLGLVQRPSGRGLLAWTSQKVDGTPNGRVRKIRPDGTLGPTLSTPGGWVNYAPLRRSKYLVAYHTKQFKDGYRELPVTIRIGP